VPGGDVAIGLIAPARGQGGHGDRGRRCRQAAAGQRDAKKGYGDPIGARREAKRGESRRLSGRRRPIRLAASWKRRRKRRQSTLKGQRKVRGPRRPLRKIDPPRTARRRKSRLDRRSIALRATCWWWPTTLTSSKASCGAHGALRGQPADHKPFQTVMQRLQERPRRGDAANTMVHSSFGLCRAARAATPEAQRR